MATPTNNPYEAPGQTREAASWSVWRVVVIIFLGLAAMPAVLMLYWLGEQFVVLYSSPSRSYRPIIGAVGFGLSILTFVIGSPIALIIRLYCSESDRQLVELFYGIAGLPILLGLVGPFIIAWLTGSSFGT